MNDQKHQKLLVVSGHAADFVWRCGGTIAKYTQAGASVHIVCVSSGARGESGKLWSGREKPSEEKVRNQRFQESRAAADMLGASLEYMDVRDHPMFYGYEDVMRLCEVMRAFRPTIVLTHGEVDVLNPDHESVFQLTRWAVRASTVPGVLPDLAAIAQPQLYTFESDQSTLDAFLPNVYIDITEVLDTKREAMDKVPTQVADMGDRYADRAAHRASLIQHFAANGPTASEAFRQHYPLNTQFFPEQS